MITYPASYPDTLSPANPLTQAACAPHDPELWFPKNRTAPEAAKATKARQICNRCPVRAACLTRALDQNEQYGIFGGLDEDERKELRSPARKPAPAQPGTGPKARDLSELYAQRAVRLPGGHVGWSGDVNVTFQGRGYTARQISFILDRGHTPTGNILTECDHPGCIQALHIADADERGRCGTVTAYRRHIARGERVDDACQKVAPQSVAS